MNESVESEALVIPSSNGATARRRLLLAVHAIILGLEAETIDLLVDEELGVADLLDLHPAHHLPHNDFDVLVVNRDALQAIDLLDLVDQVLLQRPLAEHVEDVMRVDRPVYQRLTGAHVLAFADVDVRPARHRVIPRFAGLGVCYHDLAEALGDLAEMHLPVNLRDDGRAPSVCVPRTTRRRAADHP